MAGIPVPLLGNGFDNQSILHEQVSLGAVNQIYVFHEAMTACKILFIKSLL